MHDQIMIGKIKVIEDYLLKDKDSATTKEINKDLRFNEEVKHRRIDEEQFDSIPRENLNNKKLLNDKTISMKKEFDLRKCPHCSIPIIKEEGCNFITCQSNFCKGEKFFCYICGDKLLASQKGNHFPNGIYNDSCRKIKK